MSIGLALSLTIVLVAFEWKFYGDKSLIDLSNTSGEFDEFLEIPPTEQPPPPPPATQLAFVTFREVADDEIIEDIDVEIDVEITDDLTISGDLFLPDLGEEEEVADEIFTIVEKQPEAVGGIQTFYSYISENLKYPRSATIEGVEGKVFIQFVVEADGKITDVKILKGIGMGCDEEAVRVIESAPAWNPGKQRGRPVQGSDDYAHFFLTEALAQNGEYVQRSGHSHRTLRK